MKLELPKLEQRRLPFLVGHRPWCQQDKGMRGATPLFRVNNVVYSVSSMGQMVVRLLFCFLLLLLLTS